jgi:hypothetical protein
MMAPFSTYLIAAGLLLFSLMIVNRFRGAGLMRKSVSRMVITFAVVLLAAGFTIHLRTPVGTPPPRTSAEEKQTVPKAEWSFTFEPMEVRWGGEIRLRVRPETEEFTVYFSGLPLPKRMVEKGTASVNIPANSKSGYITLDFKGTRVKAEEQLKVTRE